MVNAWVCQTTALFFVPLVPGFSTASYLKVHIKTHHGSPLPPSSTMHTYPEPRGELQMHNGNPYHMGRQCSVEGKQPSAPFPTFMLLAFNLLCCFLAIHAATSLSMFDTQAYITLRCKAFGTIVSCSYICLLFVATNWRSVNLEGAVYANHFYGKYLCCNYIFLGWWASAFQVVDRYILKYLHFT